MHDFSAGVRLNENEDEYQSALKEYRTGLVFSKTKNRQGLYTLHRADCLTLSYPLAPQGQSRRSGKVLFRDRAELNSWLKNNPWVGVLNENCHECPGAFRN